MRRFTAFLPVVAVLALAAPASAQLTTTSSWPQVGHDPGLTRRAFVTGSQTGTPAPGFPATLFPGSPQPQAGNIITAGPPAVYLDGNLIAGTNATNNTANGVAQLDYINAADVTPPAAVRALYTFGGPWPFTTGFSDTVPAVGADGVMFVAGSDGDVWGVSPNGQVVNEFTGPSGTDRVSSPTLGPNGVLYFSAGAAPDAPVNGLGAIYAVNASNGQSQWSFPITSQGAIASPVALDSQGNAYATVASFTGQGGGKLYSFNSNGGTRWTFDPPGQAAVTGSPLVYGSTIYVLGHVGNNVSTAYAVNASNGKQIWAATLRGVWAGATMSPALGPSGNVMALTFGALTALNRTTGKAAWTFTLPSATAEQPPLVDGSGDTYVFANGSSGGGTVFAVGPTGQQLWQQSVGGFVFGIPTGGTIGLDGTIYVSTSNGNIYAFTDPS
jgi:outer membrane protein assembly factor BamB